MVSEAVPCSQIIAVVANNVIRFLVAKATAAKSKNDRFHACLLKEKSKNVPPRS